ncbi:chloroquine resistance marker [Cryptosporidium sp. chipmunk genotype I]|uniref:chloroquine resistance marker n=1 Tax=Cryptosporidium sp. chipmunk genotype I TaxID=1280935 RepID=UPI00351A1F2C|nr:chloroquine resistance marker [Cryptosporidium sp. chipmunk genotype I]
MYDKPYLNEVFRRGSSLDSLLDSSKKNQAWRFSEGSMASTTREERPIISSIERETRTQERLRKLSMSIKSGGKSNTGSNEFLQNRIQIEQILLYINTGAKYNNDIYEKKEEYARMVHEIFSVGGHCYDVMVSSFRNIVSSPKVNGINMTRMDRLLNFLSFIQDLFKNYCDPEIISMIPKQRLQNRKVSNTQDYRSRSLSNIYNTDSRSLSKGDRFNKIEMKILESASKKTVQNINLKKNLFERYKIERENKNFLSSKNSQSPCGLIRQRYLGELKKTPVRDGQIFDREPIRSNPDEGGVRKVFESLQYSRKSVGEYENRAKSLSKIPISKDFVPETRMNRSRSENSLKLEETKLNLKKLEDQRIQGLQRLINKLKEVKLGSNNRETKVIESPKSSSIFLHSGSKTTRKISEICSTPVSGFLKAEKLIRTQMELLNTLNKNIRPEKCLPEKASDENNSKESTQKVKRLWELDTPYIHYRNIEFDDLKQDNTKKIYDKPVNIGYENNEVERKFTPGIPPVVYEYSEIKETNGGSQNIISESISELSPQIDWEPTEKHIKLEKSPDLPDSNEKEIQLGHSVAPEAANLGSEQVIEPEFVIPEDHLSATESRIKAMNPAFVHVPENEYIEAQETSSKNELSNSANGDPAEHLFADFSEPQKTPVHTIALNIVFNEDEQTPEPRYGLGDSPLEPIKILKNSEATTVEISKITDKLEDITMVNESLIKKIEDLPIENINVSNERLPILNSCITNSEKNSSVKEKAISMDRLPNIEYFTSGDEELRSKIEEYNYWFENASSGNYYELSLDGLNLEEFYYKNVESIPGRYDELIDMSEGSVLNLCNIICNRLPKLILEKMEKDTENKAVENKASIGIEILADFELCEEDLLSFVHEQVMKDPSYLGFKSSIRREIYPPDDNFILLTIDLIRELVQEWRDDISNFWKTPVTNELISKQVVDILCNSYEPYLSEVSSEEWVLKKVFHAPYYPNILESEKEFLNIEHLFKYHSCEDSITNEYINMDREKWLHTSDYYLPLLNEVIEQILYEVIDSVILELKAYN